MSDRGDLGNKARADGRDIRTTQGRRRRLAMSKALVLGAAALVLSAASASAQVYTTPGYGYAEPVADLAAPADGYAAPAPPPAYVAPPVLPNSDGRGHGRLDSSARGFD